MATTSNTATAIAKPEQPKRFDHPGNYVLVLTPFDQHFHDNMKHSFEDELSFLETLPSFTRELTKQDMVPSTIVYVVHPYLVREKQKADGRFKHVAKVHVSEPVEISKYYALHKANRGLDIDALQTHIMKNCIRHSSDAKDHFWIVRRTNDGGLKIFDN